MRAGLCSLCRGLVASDAASSWCRVFVNELLHFRHISLRPSDLALLRPPHNRPLKPASSCGVQPVAGCHLGPPVEAHTFVMNYCRAAGTETIRCPLCCKAGGMNGRPEKEPWARGPTWPVGRPGSVSRVVQSDRGPSRGAWERFPAG